MDELVLNRMESIDEEELETGLCGERASGVLCASTGAVHSFGAFTAVRFLLGFVEAAFYPGAMATLSTWYVQKELDVRTAIFYSESLISDAFSGLIAAGIIDGMNGVGGLLPW
ncbi:hypothetical protein FGADI_5872 [Fusarium gaditjirri]|uniref:Uncharacterized protein n=1 Tax=Fusarium gaditjirri TaxID=282569 RepID=A0A8H4WWM8_9HYPO|nr:hypothetical protein FGADI_5872 [Fusarium gaditjirri]